MPVTEQITVTYRALPITIKSDGSMTLMVRTGTTDDSVFTEISKKTVEISADDAGVIMSAHGDATKTRWNDLADALYTHLIAAGHISGTIE